jgi:3-phenylpropionate/trans-cinnamate dioxygenase ferredoxin subunit
VETPGKKTKEGKRARSGLLLIDVPKYSTSITMDKRIANVGEVEPGRCKLIRVDGVSIALFNAGGAFYAVQDYCTGDGGSLSEGALIGSAVICAADKALFYLPTGECVDPPHLARLAVYRVRIVSSEIRISLEEAPSNTAAWPGDYEMDQPST